MRRPLLAVAVTAAIAGAIAIPALAAPDRSATLTATSTAYEWDGGPVTGTPAGDESDNDDTLLTVETGGSLKVETSEADDTTLDIDLYLYRANAAGEPQGDAIKMAETTSADETVTATVTEGKYLVRVTGFVALQGFFKGKATLTPDTGGTPQPAGPTDTPPEAAIGRLAKSGKASRYRKFQGTARDDVSVARVDVALVKVKDGKCTQMTSPGKFAKLAKCDAPTKFLRAKGTTAWSYKLTKELKKGSYVLFARATDGAGHVQGGFGPASKKAFKVK
jgi:hypothetical protein